MKALFVGLMTMPGRLKLAWLKARLWWIETVGGEDGA